MESMMVLHSYLKADGDLQKIQAARSAERETILCSVYPQQDIDLGFTTFYRTSTEDAALKLVDLDNSFSVQVNACNRRTQLLNESLSLLDGRELEAVQAVLWEHTSDMTTEELNLHSEQAFNKMAAYIEQQNSDVEEQVQAGHRQELKRLIKKHGQVRS